MAKPIGTEYWTLFPPSWNSSVREFTWIKYRVVRHEPISQLKFLDVDEKPNEALFYFSVTDNVTEVIEPVDIVKYPVSLRLQMRLAGH
jgi:hypothetical protein